VRALLKLLLILPDHHTILKGSCGVPKRAAWSKPLALQKVKTVAHALDATVNDVLLTAVTGALRRYLDAREQPAPELSVRAIVPLNLRPPNEPLDLDRLGNRFGLVFLSLPVGIRNPRERLAVLKQHMEDIKHSPEALVALGILNLIGGTPTEVERIITAIFGLKGTAVMTNVPGPGQTLYFAGEPIRGIMFWVPHPANLGLGVSILSYAGQVVVGIATDAGLIPDPEAIVTAFHHEFNALARLAKGGAKSAPHPRVRTLSARTRERVPMPAQATRGK
jgi:WS/DGAT/MGAT family acyltransferase